MSADTDGPTVLPFEPRPGQRVPLGRWVWALGTLWCRFRREVSYIYDSRRRTNLFLGVPPVGRPERSTAVLRPVCLLTGGGHRRGGSVNCHLGGFGLLIKQSILHKRVYCQGRASGVAGDPPLSHKQTNMQ